MNLDQTYIDKLNSLFVLKANIENLVKDTKDHKIRQRLLEYVEQIEKEIIKRTIGE